MKAIAVLIVGLALLAVQIPLAGPALAQQPPAIDTLNLSLWPEYDRPGLLVIYRGQFAAAAPLPLSVEFRIPAQAAGPSAVAYLDEQGSLIQQEYETRSEDGQIVVAMQLPSRGFQLEYYVPLPSDAANSGATGRRSIPFTYTADYAVATLNMDVQQPPGVRAFALDPAAGSASPGSDGLTYHESKAGPLAQGDALSWTISYERTTAGLTVQAEPAATAASSPAGSAGTRPVASTPLIVAAALLAMVGVGAGSFWLGRRNAARPAAAAPRGKARSATSRPDAESPFCYQCGTRLRPGADFCQKCGAAARRGSARS